MSSSGDVRQFAEWLASIPVYEYRCCAPFVTASQKGAKNAKATVPWFSDRPLALPRKTKKTFAR